MRLNVLLSLLLFWGLGLHAQTSGISLEGTVSYVSSQNVYVKFTSTSGIYAGDTLFIIQGNQQIPILLVKELSSISCVCTSLSTVKLKVNDKLIARPKLKVNNTVTPKEEIKSTVDKKTVSPTVSKKDTAQEIKIKPKSPKQMINGRLSVASYSGFSNTIAPSDNRMRYTLSLNARNISNSKLSAESYISFVHRNKDWDPIKKNIFYGMKIYSLAAQYDISEDAKVWLGRRINPRISNVGAIDGVQLEYKINALTAGIVSGFRPDLNDYGFNADLMQYGGYLAHDFAVKKNNFQSTIAFIEQQNKGQTDRRFAYLQHANTIGGNLSLFASAEIDVYKKVIDSTENTVISNSPRLSNLFLSLNYKIFRSLSMSLSYSERQNIIYYESYNKHIIDRLLELEAMRGYSVQVRFQPFKKMSIGASAGYRDQKSDHRPSKNVYGYLTYSEIPWLKISSTLSTTLLESAYLNGKIYSLGFSKDLLKGKLSTGISYRYVDYKIINSETNILQHMGEANLNWRIIKKLSLSLNYEGTFERLNVFNNIYINLSKSF